MDLVLLIVLILLLSGGWGYGRWGGNAGFAPAGNILGLLLLVVVIVLVLRLVGGHAYF